MCDQRTESRVEFLGLFGVARSHRDKYFYRPRVEKAL